MQKIELSDATYRRLLSRLNTFGETPEDVIHRLLDEVGTHNPRREVIKEALQQNLARATPGSILAEREYWRPILEIVARRGGSAPAGEVIEELGERLKDDFTSLDLERLNTGAVRWRNRARFARLRMTEQGLLSDTAARGTWEITDAGRAYIEADL